MLIMLPHHINRLSDAYYRFMRKHFLWVLIPAFSIPILPLIAFQLGFISNLLGAAISIPMFVFSIALCGLCTMLDGSAYDPRAAAADLRIVRRDRIRRKHVDLRHATDEIIDGLYSL